MKYLPYARQSIDASSAHDVAAVLTSDIITRGPKVDEFEDVVAEYCGAHYAVAYNSGTTALQAACYAAQAGPNDAIISSPITFVASVGAGIHFSCRPQFVDIDLSTGNIDVDKVGALLERPRSRGKDIVVPVHFAGVPVDMERLSVQIKNPDVVIIEDAAHALGSKYKDGSRVGSCTWSNMTVLSFHPAKNITTGEGGMVTTNDEALFRRLRYYRNNGIERDKDALGGDPDPWYYEVRDITGNYNFTDFQAVLGLGQMKNLENAIQKRQRLMECYKEGLADIPHVKMLSPEVNAHVAYHLCVVLIDYEALGTSRRRVVETLKERGIGTQVHYIPLYRHPFFTKRYGDLGRECHNAETYYSQALSLPLYYDLTVEDVSRVCAELRATVGAGLISPPQSR